jgi:2-keto-4-pentenoate hydratase/2-oxohepta-3-ene-1,7-dioic acid hydratase in catechol pathway
MKKLFKIGLIMQGGTSWIGGTEYIKNIILALSSLPNEERETFEICLLYNQDIAPDIQNQLKAKGLPWEKAKAWDGSACIGKWKDMNTVKKPINFSLNLNGTQVQKGNTADMIFSFDKIVAHISEYFSLNIGDLIFTGTPAGVDECVVTDVLTGFLENEQVFEVEVK